MQRNIGVEFPDALCHVTICGDGRQAIFSDDHDRERFVRRLAESVDAYGIRLYQVKYIGLTYREVADTLGMRSGVGASLQARRAKELKECDREAAKLIAAIEDELDGQIPEPVCK